MSRRRIGQESFGWGPSGSVRASSLDGLHDLIDWVPIEARLSPISSAAKGEPAWPPLALFKALLLSVWYDLSDAKLAEALDDRTSFRRFCGFSRSESTPAALAALTDQEGAFNEVVLELQAHARAPMVIDQLDQMLEPYGGLGAYGLDRQISDYFLSQDRKSVV